MRYSPRMDVKMDHREHAAAHTALEHAIQRHDQRASHPDLAPHAKERERNHAQGLRKIKQHITHGHGALTPAS